MNDRRAAFGVLLRHFRRESGLLQETLAERAGMSVQTIGALERGARRYPYRETMTLLADALRLSAGDRVRLENAAVRPHIPRRVLSGEVADDGPAPNGIHDSVSVLVESFASLHNLPSETSSLIGRQEVAAG